MTAFEFRVYLTLTFLTTCLLLALLPFIELVVGTLLLVGLTAYSYATILVGLPPLMTCASYCGGR